MGMHFNWPAVTTPAGQLLAQLAALLVGGKLAAQRNWASELAAWLAAKQREPLLIGRLFDARCRARYAAGESAEGSAPREAPETDGCKADCRVDCLHIQKRTFSRKAHLGRSRKHIFLKNLGLQLAQLTAILFQDCID